MPRVAHIFRVRLNLYWQDVEPNPGPFDFQTDDAGPPDTLTDSPPGDYAEWAAFHFYLRPDQAPEGFADFKAALTHFGRVFPFQLDENPYAPSGFGLLRPDLGPQPGREALQGLEASRQLPA